MGSCQCRKFCEQEQASSNLQLQEVATNDDYRVAETTAELQIKIRTWLKESFSLFDYENQNQLKEQIFQIRNGGWLVKNNNDIEWVDEEIDWGKSVYKQDQALFQIKRVDGTFCIINSRLCLKYKEVEEDQRCEQATKYQGENKDFQQSENLDHLEGDEFHPPNNELVKKSASMSQRTNTKLLEKGTKLWLVLRSTQNQLSRQGVRIKEGDVVKMGRVKFRVREINLFMKKEQLFESDSAKSSQSDAITCRVCCSSSHSRSNPLVNPCKCSGSIKYIHLECLKKWLKAKLHTRQSEHSVIYMWKNLECELCKFTYPPVFKSDEGFYDLVELSKPTDYPYVLMEITQKRYDDAHENQGNADEGQQYNQCNGVYIISFDRSRDLKIGRANETEIRVNDISVSRSHAVLRLTDGQVYISDNKSKFGTLLLLQQQKIPLLKEFSGMELQVGRSVIQFQVGSSQGGGLISSEVFEQFLNGDNDDD